MTLDITVRGSAEQHHPAERASVTLAATIEGSDKAQAFADAVGIQDPLSAQLKDLAEQQAVTTWSSDQVRVVSHRPWDGDGSRGAAVHVARVQVRAEFVDFERLGAFLDHWAGVDGVEVGEIVWDVSEGSRRGLEAAVRKAAVDDAVAKAQTYANALRRGKVVAVQVADPGMLTPQGEGQPTPLVKAVAFGGDAAPGLDLTPEEIAVRVEVDARFIAD